MKDSLCQTCGNFDKENHFCRANLWSKEYPMRCYFRMVIQELRTTNMILDTEPDFEEEIEEADWWKK